MCLSSVFSFFKKIRVRGEAWWNSAENRIRDARIRLSVELPRSLRYCFPILFGRHAVCEEEVAVETGRGFEADGEGYLIDRHVGFTQQTCRLGQAHVAQVFGESLVVGLFEFLGERGAVGAEGTTHIIPRQFFVAEPIIPKHDFFQLLPEPAERVIGYRRAERSRGRHLRDMFDSEAKQRPADRRYNQVDRIRPFCKAQQGAKKVYKNDGDKCGGTCENHRCGVDMAIAVEEATFITILSIRRSTNGAFCSITTSARCSVSSRRRIYKVSASAVKCT